MTTPPTRLEYVGSSDAKRILDGDWLALYQEKLGLKAPEDLSHNFPVQLGVLTEPFHISWLNKYCGFDIVLQHALHRMAGQPHIGCHLDGWCRTHGTFVDTKHSNGRAGRDSMVEWYQPQFAHICNVEGVASGILSYIAGNQAPEWFAMEPSPAYRQALLDMENAFWWHVENKEPPNVTLLAPKLEEARREARDVRLDGMRAVDMSGNNAWASHATDYLLNEGAAGIFEKAKKKLKELVEADVREARGHGIVIKRSKNGSLRFSEGDE